MYATSPVSPKSYTVMMFGWFRPANAFASWRKRAKYPARSSEPMPTSTVLIATTRSSTVSRLL